MFLHCSSTVNGCICCSLSLRLNSLKQVKQFLLSNAHFFLMYHFTVMTSLFNTLTPNKMSSLDIFLHYHNTHLNASQPNQSSPAAYNSLPLAARWVITVPNEIQCSALRVKAIDSVPKYQPLSHQVRATGNIWSLLCVGPLSLSIYSFHIIPCRRSRSLPLYLPWFQSISRSPSLFSSLKLYFFSVLQQLITALHQHEGTIMLCSGLSGLMLV